MKIRTINQFGFGIMLMLLVVLLQGCGPSSESKNTASGEIKGNISISGAFALYPMTVKWAEEYQKKFPDVRIDISAGGAGKGMADALSDMVDLGMFSRGIHQAEIDKGAWGIAVTKDAVVPTINAKNPFLDQLKNTGFSKDLFVKIFIDQTVKQWNQCPGISGDNTSIHVFTRSDACGAAQMWGEFLGKDQESLQGIGVFGDPGMADAIKGDATALGFNNVGYAYDMRTRKTFEGLEILPLDVNNNGQIDPEEDFYGSLDKMMAAIAEGKYPSPPARDLYLVSHGKPKNPVVIHFLNWILTEGQQFVSEAGYVQLSPEKIQKELDKIK
jgi:phosphate transport system substrate-binding protein